jgi:two-component system C4-dicarboxylate transport sensor histidine kinase DctB
VGVVHLIEARAVPRPTPEALGSPRRTLRRKGLALFAVISLYVIAGFGFIAWQGLRLVGSVPGSTGGIEPLIAVASVMVLLGMVVFGAFLTQFLGRLAADLGALQARSLEVAEGGRGLAPRIDRDDEVGILARAVEKMASDLRERETEIAEARLEQFHNERMTLLGGIAAGVAHEIGNPAGAIAAIAAEIEAARREGRPEQCEVRDLTALAGRLAAIARRLSAIAGTRSKQTGTISLNPLVESVASLLALDLRFGGIAIAAELDRALPAVRACEDDIVQLLLHLLANAAEAFPGGRAQARIAVATRREGPWAALEVRDNGRGMDPATAARAFEPFFTTKPPGRGNGLGLDACRRIVERHGGTIALSSAEGEGTVVCCRFPAEADAADGPVLDFPKPARTVE